MNWFVSAGSRPEAPVRLFCLPYAGAGASAFRRWASEFGESVDVTPVQLPGRENRITEDPRFSVAEVADAIVSRADRPYAIYGHSMGGRLGFDVVRELRRTGRPLPLRLYVGGARAPHVRTPGPFDGLSRASDDELLRRLGEGGGLPAELLDHPELVELLLPLLRADFGRVDDYRHVPGEPLPVPIVAFAGRTDRAVTRDQNAAWAEHTAAGFTLHELDGGHFFLHDRLPELAALIRADLTAALSDPRAGTPDAGPDPVRAAGRGTAGAAHRVPLGDTGWSVWRDAVLRTTGFPADGLELFSAPRAATAADELLATGAGADRFDKEFEEALRSGAQRFSALAADPLLREAVTWQNRGALVAFDGLVRGGADAARNVRRRDRERALLKYWQRYCGKNETVGFFGPSCWVTVDPAQPEVARVNPGDRLTRRRWVWFESWALTAYADRIGADLAVRRWWPPMLRPHLAVRDRAVLRPGRPPLTLTPVEAELLRAADGRRPAADLVADPAIGLRRPEDGYALLDRLVERELITWDAALPVSPDAERVLADRIEAIGDEPARAAARAGFDRLRAARDEVAAAAGDAERLRAALDALDATFTELTGVPAVRRAGQMYAGRTVCYEDSARDLDVVFGAPLLAELAAPLDVLLRAARWLANALARAYLDVLRGLYEELRAESGGPVPLADLWFLAQGMFWGDGERPVDAVAAEFAARWSGLFGLDTLPPGSTDVRLRAADLADRIDAVFPGAGPEWSNAAIHSPDLQICATDADALRRGDYTVVLGELHAAWSSFDCAVFTPSHPDVERLRDALAADLGQRRVRLLFPADWPRRTSRTAESLTGPTDRHLAFLDAPGADPARVLPTVDLVVDDVDGELVATASDGQRWPLTEIFAEPFSAHAVDGFKLVAAAPYTPRITVDRLVLARQTWRTTVGESGLAVPNGERERFLAVRDWRRRLGLPEQVYVKFGTETKPCFVDLSAPAFATTLCAMARAARVDGGDDVSFTVSEMLPAPEQAWVPDGQGRRYFSELRLHITDARREDHR
ncbi:MULTISPECIES: thioesterase domain-containing protein [unclassified Micromonospora]|uniref:thioesterase domain-containing protein n=1 Tax=unclassified Micromonospora TaxID=2617518 RepID=UPI00112E5FC9|nr:MULTISPECIES: thioesterase domain-containing protein [unclassified Micromonospora]MCK1807754.1 lantibiotic dehydratase [Micromonospora sp. R42106]MCK1835450.1 lantibiotic dehydratase [Micromonospora sp. R42003]MCK1843875.1 lantibiotic dehydratase [Micromonospora sp. R42004]MCM1016197.1 lantibiotic dehydratase [Micromonospora sp. XM-20-01]